MKLGLHQNIHLLSQTWMIMITYPSPNRTSHGLVSLVLVGFLLSYTISTNKNNNNNNIKCVSNERQALLQFKHGIKVDRCGLLSSWGGNHDDCCQWHGIHCHNHTSHVIMLDLGGNEVDNGPCLEGSLSPSLLELKHLKYLDLSFNKFQGHPIPSFIGSLINLKHLNLSNSCFVGEIPHHLGNLSHLRRLDLSENQVHVDTLWWLSHLTSLRELNLSGIDLSKALDFFQIVNNLPFLRFLNMDWCQLSPEPITSSLSYMNSSTTLHVLSLAHNGFSDTSIFQWLFNLTGISTHLVHVDLSDNAILGTIPGYFGNMHILSYLDLSSNQLEGPIPINFRNMCSLSHLDLSANVLEGLVPSLSGNMHSLSYLDLSGNGFEGPISESISNLENLAHLDLSWNHFRGSPLKNIGKLCSLQFLELSYNNFTDELSNIIQTLSGCAYKRLVFFSLTKNQVWGSIPDTISTFPSLRELYLDHNRLNCTISQGIGQLSMLRGLHLSSNSLKGTFSSRHLLNISRLNDLVLSNNPELEINIKANWIPPFQLDTIDLGFCKLGPYFPKWILSQTSFSWFDISNGGISDTVPASFWKSLSSHLLYLNVSQNMMRGMLPDVSISFLNFPEIDLGSNDFTGAIPSFRGNISSLYLNNNRFSDPIPFLCPRTEMVLSNLDMSNNFLSGKLPDCWMNFKQLSVLHLENNNFSGNLPASFVALKQLKTLHLRYNSLSGELPLSLESCTSLVILDLSYNFLTGYIPPRIGNSLKSLGILSLRSNSFLGSLPRSLCYLSHLQILDISINHISGEIPKCINNLTAMKSSENMLPQILSQGSINSFFSYYDAEWVMWKRKERSFKNSFGEVKSIDISCNELEGQIPKGISSLHGLVFLNLSRNNLSGNIASNIGQMTSLEFLDLSNNHISGEIPESLASLSSLEILDFSNNNLSGKIPTGTQLQGFDASTYSGNPRLCGPPLANCREDQVPISPLNGDDITHHDENANDDIVLGLCISVLLGFILGFWGVCGTLVLKRTWRHAYFQFVDDMKDKIYVTLVVKVARACRKP